MARFSCSCYGPLSALEAWITGYKPEHYKLGLQMAVALCLSLIPILVDRAYKSLDRNGSVLYTAVTVVVVLEPNTGDSFRKLLMRAAGCGLAGGLGMFVMWLAVGDDPTNYKTFGHVLAPWVVPAAAIISFAFMVNHERYWRHHAFWRTALFTLPCVMVPALRADPQYFYRAAAFRMLGILLGIAIAAVVSYVVLPVRARDLLTKKMASTLIRVGDMAVWLIGQVCVLPQPGSDGRVPGSSGTDLDFTYTDDGLRAKMAPLVATASELSSDLAYMRELLQSARAELYLLRSPHTFPTKQYQMLLDACFVVVGVFHSMLCMLEGNEVSLHVCQRHIGDLSEVGVRLSAAFTALSSLIRPPKSKGGKKGWWGRRQARNLARQLKAAMGADTAAKEAAATAAVLEEEVRRRQLEKEAAAAAADGKLGSSNAGIGGGGGAGGTTSSGAAAVAAAGPAPGAPGWRSESGLSEGDDPFASLADGLETGAATRRPVVALTDSELMSAQTMARHLSVVVSRHATERLRGAAAGTPTAALAPLLDQASQEAAALEAAAAAAEAEVGAGGAGAREAGAGGDVGAGVAAEVAPPLDPKSSLGLSGLSSVKPGKDARSEWVLRKLRGLVDAVGALEVAVQQERDVDAGKVGLRTFVVVVHACTMLSRQCCTCLTALDPKRGAQLHEHYLQTRQREQLLGAGGAPQP